MLILDLLNYAWRMGFMPFVGGGGSQNYEIQKSLRFRASASAHLNRSFTGSGYQTATFSAWVKIGALGTNTAIAQSYATASDFFVLRRNASNQLTLYSVISGVDYGYAFTPSYRDPSAWYHIQFVLDSTNATAADRMRLYVNGARVTAVTTNYGDPPLNYTFFLFRSAYSNYIGRDQDAGTYFDGYMSEIRFIDGQALTPSSFGQTDSATGAWVPKKYTGTYGTNGFYLGFSDGTSLTTLGNDESGNNNDWTLNNISITSGVTYDWMDDTPTNNFAVINPLVSATGIANANLTLTATGVALYKTATIKVPTSGQWYWEYTAGSVGSVVGQLIGIVSIDSPAVANPVENRGYATNGVKYTNGSSSAYGAAFTAADIIGVAYDASAGTLTFYKNGVSQGVAFSGLSAIQWNAYMQYGATGTNTGHLNFGQRPFAYTPPTGFKALCTKNLPTPAIKKSSRYFNAKTRTGTGAAVSVTGIGHQTDLLWIKNRGAAISNVVVDAVRGGSAVLNTDLTAAETTASTVSSFDSDGFSLVSTGSGSNQNGVAYIDWSWKESVTSGVDIVTYTGTGVARTVAHNLSVVPAFGIFKSRSGTFSWGVYHKSLGATQAVFLDLTNAAAASANYFNNTAPTSSQITFGIGSAFNDADDTYVGYLFGEVEGFSKFGSYTGNGSADGPFIWCGFRPRWIMFKRTDSTENWYVYDTARDTYNVVGSRLYANLTNAELGSQTDLDLLSNGVKIRRNDTPFNASGGTYIFAAFAETPFKYANAR
jgi:hypothetical protein